MSIHDEIEVGFSATRTVKAARVEHKCICGATIPVGATYRRHVALIDGELSVDKEGCGCHGDDLEPYGDGDQHEEGW
jgi:hypothetical protein